MRKRGFSGCSFNGETAMKKFLLIILILIIAGLAYIYINKDKIAQMAVEKSIPLVESTMMQNLPAGVDKDDVESLFADVTKLAKEGKIDIVKMQGLLGDFQKAMKDKKVDEAEFNKMYEELKKLAGR
jgi:hypothetical protein